MQQSLLKTLSTFQGKMKIADFANLFAGCSAWAYLTVSKRLDEQQAFDGNASLLKLVQVLNDCVTIYFNPERWKISDSDLASLTDSLCQLLKNNVLKASDLARAFSEMLEMDAGHHTIPEELCELVLKLLPPDINSVYCPFEKGADFAKRLPTKVEAVVETPAEDDLFYTDIQALLNEKEIRSCESDPIASPYFTADGGLRKFEAAVAMPPFGLKMKNEPKGDIWSRFPEKSLMSEVYFLRHMLSQTDNLAICIVASSFLFRTAAGERQFKQSVISNDWLKAVIALPEKLLSHTQIPLNILIFDKNKPDSAIQFIDASGEKFYTKKSRTRNLLCNIETIVAAYGEPSDSAISSRNSVDDISVAEFNLSPSRYVKSEEDRNLESFISKFTTRKLSEIAEIVRPQAIKHDELGSVNLSEFGLSDLNEIGELSGYGKKIKILPSEERKARKQMIKPNDLLVVCRGAVGTVGIAGTNIPDTSLANQAFAIVRLKQDIGGINADALFQYLSSEFGQYQLKSLATGTTALMLASKDLDNISVPLFSEEQLKVVTNSRSEAKSKFAEIEKMKRELEKISTSWIADMN